MRWNRRPSRTPDAGPGPGLVSFVAYATDCVLVAKVALEGDRLSDLLATRDEYEIQDVQLEGLAEGGVIELTTATVRRLDLCVVAAPSPRGHPQRRVRTRPHPVRAKLGPYEVSGYIHAMPTADPIAAALRRRVIPLTFGSIRYERGGETVERNHDAIVLNREQLDWLVEAGEEEVALQSPVPDTRGTSAAREIHTS